MSKQINFFLDSNQAEDTTDFGERLTRKEMEQIAEQFRAQKKEYEANHKVTMAEQRKRSLYY